MCDGWLTPSGLSTGSAQILLTLKIYYPERMHPDRKYDVRSNPENPQHAIILSLEATLSKQSSL